MGITGFIEPIWLSDEEKQDGKRIAERLNPIIVKLSMRVYGEVSYADLKRDIAANKIKLTKVETAAINELNQLTHQLLGGYVLCAAGLARSFYRSKINSTLSYDDYFQEAVIKIFDCAFSYDGSTQFITYLTAAIHRRLLTLSRDDCYSSTPSQEITDKLFQVYSLMTKEEISFEDASAKLGLSKKDFKNVKNAGIYTVLFSQVKVIKNQYDKVRSFEDTIEDVRIQLDALEGAELWAAFQAADLSEFEKAVFDAYLLAADDRFRSDVAVKFGKSRAAAGLAFNRAKAKIRHAYENRHPSKLAA